LAVGDRQLPARCCNSWASIKVGTTGPENKWLLNQALRLDDDVSTFYIRSTIWYPPILNRRLVRLRTTTTADTPDPGICSGVASLLDGLLSACRFLSTSKLFLARHRIHDQITLLVSVWRVGSAIAWWSGLRFDDLLACLSAGLPGKVAHLESSVNLDVNGNPDPYFVSMTC